MNIQSLRYALTLAEELHFGRAAARHFIAPQAFGRHIQRLEREVGARLFDRTSRSVRLTSAGRQVMVRARHVLAELDELPDAARAVHTDNGQLRVGVLGFGMAERWPYLRDVVTERLPGVELVHVEVDWDSQFDAVRSGEVDVGIVHDVGPVDGLRLDRVLQVDRVAVVPAGSAFAEAARLRMTDFDGQPWVRVLGRHPGLAAWAGATGESSRRSPTVRTPAAIPAAVATSGMPGVHGEPARHFFARPDVRFIPLDGPPAVVSVATRATDRRACAEVFRHAARTVAQLCDQNQSGT